MDAPAAAPAEKSSYPYDVSEILKNSIAASCSETPPPMQYGQKYEECVRAVAAAVLLQDAATPAEEFAELERKAKLVGHALGPVSGRPENKGKNRFLNCTGPELTQVLLQLCDECAECKAPRPSLPHLLANLQTQVTEGFPSCTYINANFVHAPAGDMFICTQAPMSAAVNGIDTQCAFWQMVWSRRVRLVVCLAHVYDSLPQVDCQTGADTVARDNLNETQNRALVRYWPANRQPTRYGDLDMCLLSNTSRVVMPDGETDAVTYKHLILRQTPASYGSMQENVVHLILYEEWPDMGVPRSASAFARFVELMDSVWETQRHNDDRKPAVVHCVAGVGRTGVYTAAHYALLEAKQRKCTPTHKIVSTLRESRRGLVQTQAQYEFLCETVRIIRANEEKKRPVVDKK